MNTGNNSVAANQWHHVVLQKSSNSTKFFINGVHKGTAYTDNLTYVAGGTLYIGKRWTAGPFALDGHIADFRIVKGTAVYNHSGFTPPTAPLTAIANTKLLTCNDAPNVYNTAGRSTVVLGGDAKASTTQTKNASASMYFDGTGDRVDFADLGVGTGDFEIECWFRQTVAQSYDYRCIYGASPYSGSGPFALFTWGNLLRAYIQGNSWIEYSPFSINTWYHLALKRQHGIWTFFVDGVSQGTNTLHATYDFGSTTDWSIMGHPTSTSYNNAGYVEDFRITQGFCRYPFVPHTTTHTSDASTILLAAHASTIVDGSSNSRTITSNSAPTVSTSIAPKAGMNSIYFDGSDDFITTAASNDWGFGTGAYTIEFWYKSTDTDGEVVSAFDPSSPYAGWSVRLTNGLVTYYVHNGSSGTGWEAVGGSVAINDDEWHHVALTSANASSTVKCFIDGSFVGSSAMSNIHPSSTGYALRIGAATNASSSNWRPTAGYISNVRLSSTERYTNSFTPPTAELEA